GARDGGGAAHDALARPAESGDAGARRVQDADGPRAARARRRRPRRLDRDRGERLRRRARAARRADRRRGRGRRDVRRRARRRRRAADLRQDGQAADDPAGGGGSLSTLSPAGWPEILVEHAADALTARRLIAQLRACEASALAFCRLLERWARGDAEPPTPGGRQAALRRAADRAETALAGLERPLGRYLLELEPERAEGRSWYGEPGSAELVDWEPVLVRA